MPQIDSSHSSSLRSRLWGSVKRKCEREREREGGEERGKAGQKRPPSSPEDSDEVNSDSPKECVCSHLCVRVDLCGNQGEVEGKETVSSTESPSKTLQHVL